MRSSRAGSMVSRWVVAAVFAVLLLIPASAHAAVVKMDLEDLAREADAIVVVKVTGSKSRDASAGRSQRPDIVTDSRVQVTRVIAGDRRPELTITQPGGVIGDLGLEVSDVPEFSPGERAILFLDAEDRIVGAFQGKLLIEQGRVLGYDVNVNELAQRIIEYRTGISPASFSPVHLPVSVELFAITPTVTEAEDASTVVTASSPTITSISPEKQISGANRTVVITGSGFGSSAGSVNFTDGKSLPAVRRNGSIVSWTNTRIEVIVPGPVAAGEVRVVTSAGTATRNYNVGFASLGRTFADPVVSYRINENCPDMTGEGAEIRKAFDTWNAAGSNFKVNYAGTSAYATYPPQQNQRNDIFFSSNFGASNALAVNYSWFWASTGTIIESDIIFNDNYTWGANSASGVWDVQSIALHEVGHTVGLDDQYVNYDRVMGAAVGGRNRRALSEHEIAGAIFLHGAETPAPAAPAVSSSSHPSQSAWHNAAMASLTVTAASGSPVAGYSWVIDGSPTTDPNSTINTTSSSISTTIAEGDRWFHVRAIGEDGRPSPTTHYRLRTDRTAPSGSVQIGAASQFISGNTIQFSASLTDGLSGLSQMRFDTGSGWGAWQAFSAQGAAAIAGADGTRTVSAEYRDAAGNVAQFSRTLTVDRVAPTTSAGNVAATHEGPVQITLSASDDLSGVGSTFFGVNASPVTPYTGPIHVTAAGAYTVSFYSVDRAGNAEPVRTISFTIAPTNSTQAVVARVDGRDRYVVAAAVAKLAHPEWQGVTNIVIASGDDRAAADPLSASGLAGSLNAPVLLARDRLVNGQLPAPTERAISEIKAANGGKVAIHIVGGPNTIPADVYNRLAAIRGTGGTIRRITGQNRYDLSVSVANETVKALGGASKVPGVLIANGQDANAFYDALAASPIAFRSHRPLLLTQSTSVPASVSSALSTTFAGKPRTVVNASGYVSNSVYSAVGASSRMATTTERRRAATQIADHALLRGWLPPSKVAVANRLPDALTGGSAMGSLGGPLVYTDADGLCTTTRAWLDSRRGVATDIFVVGGEISITPQTFMSVSSTVQ